MGVAMNDTSKKLPLRALRGEAISLKLTDRFGSALRSPEKRDKKRLAMTRGCFRKKWLEATWC
jgi:hypothetical protein